MLIPSAYSHFSSGFHLAPRSDFAGVQRAQHPLAYKVERSETVANTQGSLLYARSTPAEDEILIRLSSSYSETNSQFIISSLFRAKFHNHIYTTHFIYKGSDYYGRRTMVRR